jgi:hypothetical protein
MYRSSVLGPTGTTTWGVSEQNRKPFSASLENQRTPNDDVRGAHILPANNLDNGSIPQGTHTKIRAGFAGAGSPFLSALSCACKEGGDERIQGSAPFLSPPQTNPFYRSTHHPDVSEKSLGKPPIVPSGSPWVGRATTKRILISLPVPAVASYSIFSRLRRDGREDTMDGDDEDQPFWSK